MASEAEQAGEDFLIALLKNEAKSMKCNMSREGTRASSSQAALGCLCLLQQGEGRCELWRPGAADLPFQGSAQLLAALVLL